MRTPITKLLGLGLATLTLGASWVAAPAHAETTPAPTSVKKLALGASAASVTVDGRSYRVLASLQATTASFDLVGMTWQSLPADAIAQVRVRTTTGWGEWTKLEWQPTQDASSAERRTLGSDPLWTGAANQVEARVLGAAGQSAQGVQLSLVDTTQVAADAALPQPSSQVRAAAVSTEPTYASRPTIVSRAQWGADESWLSINGASCVPANTDTTVKAAIVHHTAGTNSYTKEQSASIVRGIYAYHVKSMGWCDVGYNFLIDKYGQIFEGRHGGMDLPVHGAHATTWNTDTVGVSVMMNSETAVQSPEAMTSVSRVLAWKLAGNYRDPLATLSLGGKTINRIARHGDVMQTACPGRNITAYMPTLRSRVNSAMGNWRTPIYLAWQAQGGESGKLGSPFGLERPIGAGRVTDFGQGAIYQNSAGATFWMGKPTADRYASLGRVTSWLGWPTANQTTGPVSGSTRTNFTGGTIVASSAGAQAVPATVARWLDASNGWATYGLPTGAPVFTTSTSGYQQFQGGRIEWTGTTARPTVAGGSGAQGDLDGDRRADALALSSASTVTWWPTGSDLTAGAPVKGATLPGGPYTWVSHLPDVNGDKMTELVATKPDGTLWAWEGRGRGQYVNGRQIGKNWQLMRQLNIVPDMTGDGLNELVAINGEQKLYRYSFASNLGIKQTLQIGKNWGGIVHMTSVGDFRRNGTVDILAVTRDGLLLDYFGTKSGTLSGSAQVGHGWTGMTRVRSIGDVNGDGWWDLAANRESGPLYVYVNRGGWWPSPVKLLPEVAGLGRLA